MKAALKIFSMYIFILTIGTHFTIKLEFIKIKQITLVRVLTLTSGRLEVEIRP